MTQGSLSPPSPPLRKQPNSQPAPLAQWVSSSVWKRLTPRLNRYIPVNLTPKQTAFLLDNRLEALFGGAAGGGKSVALLVAALQYADVPHYSALLLRRTYKELHMEGSLIDLAHTFLDQTDATWSAGHVRWTFPSGATLAFGYLQHDDDRFQYQSARFHFVGFDELTQWKRAVGYRYLFSRLRRPALPCVYCGTPVDVGADDAWTHVNAVSCDAATPDRSILAAYPAAADGLTAFTVPLRMRAGTNPGGHGHSWVHARFIQQPGRFYPAKLTDNPYLDQAAYRLALAQLDPITRLQLEAGDWSIRPVGTMLPSHKFRIADEAPAGAQWVRYWDLAASDPSENDGDPDWTAGAKIALVNGQWWIADLRRTRALPHDVEALIGLTATVDGQLVPIHIEQEPGGSGKTVVAHYQRTVLPGWPVWPHPPRGDKVRRAMPLSAAVHSGNVVLVKGPWLEAFLDECDAFPNGDHDDQVDAVTGGMAVISNPTRRGGLRG